MYIIPSIYIRDHKTVALAKGGVPFDEDPVKMAHKLALLGAEIIYILDLNVPPAGNVQHLPIIENIVKQTGLKIQLAGYIKSEDVVDHYIKAGVERVVLGAIAYQKPDFLKKVCKKYPGRIAVHIDVRGGKVIIQGWTVAAKKTAIDYTEQFKEAGVGTVLYSEVESEGKITPTDISKIMLFSRKSPLPIIHATDVSSPKELELVLGLKSNKIVGTIIGRSMYSGIIDISSTITHGIEEAPAGTDEPTLIG